MGSIGYVIWIFWKILSKIIKINQFVPEGVESRFIQRKSFKIIYQLQGTKSSMGYIGAQKIKEISNRSKFIKITKAGFYESMVHSVETIKSTTNFKIWAILDFY